MKLNDIKIKPKPCKVCKEIFQPARMIQPVCFNFDCMLAYANKSAEKAALAREKKAKRETKEKLAKIKTRQEHLKDAQRFFNIYIRVRDEALPCISCGRFHNGQYHAGHYRTVGSSPSLRFEVSNCHKQCAPCNNHLSGNIVNYRLALIKKIGLEKLEWLEGPHEAKHYSIEEIQAIKVKYKQMTKELKDAS
jgi:hypothetical protein